MVRDLVERAWRSGVDTLFLGDLKGIRENNDLGRRTNQKIHNFWSFRYIVRRMREVAEEYGIRVEEVDESYTSKTCSVCGVRHRNGRKHRGLYICKKRDKAINADLNGARNILNVAVNPTEDSGSGPVAEPLLLRWNYNEWR